MKRLLDEWNAGLARLDEALGSNRDRGNTPQIIERQGAKSHTDCQPGARTRTTIPSGPDTVKGRRSPEWYCL
jgi:hypothetical protein